MPLFEIAIIRKPTKKEVEEGTGEEGLVLKPTAVLARDANAAVIQAVTTNKLEGFDANKCEVLVRPFAGA